MNQFLRGIFIMKSHYLKGLLGIGFLLFNFTAAAEDIDLFVGNVQKNTDLPNVILVIDNAANFSVQCIDEMFHRRYAYQIGRHSGRYRAMRSVQRHQWFA